MFDIGFQEVVLIAVIGLVVIGPERLPKLARTLGVYLGRLRRFVTDVRSDVERELHAEELRQSLRETAEVDDLYDMVEETKSSLTGMRDQIRDEVEAGRKSIDAAAAAAKDGQTLPESDTAPATAAEPDAARSETGHTDRDPSTDPAPAASVSRDAEGVGEVTQVQAGSDGAVADDPSSREQIDGRTGT